LMKPVGAGFIRRSFIDENRSFTVTSEHVAGRTKISIVFFAERCPMRSG
jgi:hypothetical protein